VNYQKAVTSPRTPKHATLIAKRSTYLVISYAEWIPVHVFVLAAWVKAAQFDVVIASSEKSRS